MKDFAWLEPYLNGLKLYDLLIFIAIVGLGWMIQRFFLKPLIQKIVSLQDRYHQKVGARFLEQFSPSIRYAFVTITIFFALSIIMEVSLFNHPKSKLFFYSFIVFFVFKGVYDTLTYYSYNPRSFQILGRNETFITPFVIRIIKVVTAVLAVFTIAFMWGFNLNGFLTGIGLTSVALAFGVRDTSSHIFAGLSVGLDKPFQIGDWVATEDQKIEGVIEDINLRSTLIQTTDKGLVYVPNAYLLNRPLYNFTNRDKRKVEHYIYFSTANSEEKIRNFCDTLTEQIYLHLLTEKKLIYVHVDEFIGDTYKILIRFYVMTNDGIVVQDVKQDIIFAAKQIIDHNNIVLSEPKQHNWNHE
ncbi:MAG: mechanosensitive ion channel family protein [Lysinibacillus sp.]